MSTKLLYSSMAAMGLSNERRAVYEYLRSLGCCQRCCLRYLGERDSNSYNCVEETLVKVYYMSFFYYRITNGGT
jgi:hypothetical protein